MKLKIGELAQRAGLTVRALRHYDAIGLLPPSARSDAGYRLYDRSDIARLHQIQALRRFGVALADIATFLESPDSRLSAIVDQQIAALTRQIAQAGLLREQLSQLQRQLAKGEEPALADWLTTLELMTMYDKYFTKEQTERLPLFNLEAGSVAEWDTMVARMQALMEANTSPADPPLQQLARNWMIMLERDTGGDADLLVRLNRMHASEPSVQLRYGITPALGQFVQAAWGAFRLGLYRKYLNADEFAFMQANFGKHAHEWAPLIARVQQAIDAGDAADGPAGMQLSREWMALFSTYAGTDPVTYAKLRLAHESEPDLMAGSFVSEQVLTFIKAGVAAAMQRKAP